MKDVKRTVGKPHDKLTRLGDAMIGELVANPENSDDDVKCIVFLQDAKQGGIAIHGYESDNEAMVDIFVHLTAVFHCFPLADPMAVEAVTDG